MLNGIFTNPAFGMEALTDSILQIPYMPTQARALGIFANEGIPTTTLDIELDAINFSLIPNTKRGAPATNYREGKRVMRSLKVPHLQLADTIHPEEIQGVRLFGSANELVSAQAVVQRRLMGMAMSHDATLEYQSVGALTGVIYDADGSTVIYNLFTEFGISQTSFDFLLGDANQDMKHLCLKVVRAIKVALGAMMYQRIHCFCGKDWFDAFVAHPDVVAAYRLWQDRSSGGGGQYGDFARSDNRSGFEFAGITFENYIGGVTSDFIPAGEAHFFPVGVPNLFRTVFAPGNFWSTANTIGLPRYAVGEPMRMGRGLELLTESNPLCYCTRPLTLVKATTSSYPTGIP